MQFHSSCHEPERHTPEIVELCASQYEADRLNIETILCKSENAAHVTIDEVGLRASC